jgi:hypothetical protein
VSRFGDDADRRHPGGRFGRESAVVGGSVRRECFAASQGERLVRELVATFGREEAQRILARVARIMERARREPEFLAALVSMMERSGEG